MKTSELTGPTLDWAVAKCEGGSTMYWEGTVQWRGPEGKWSREPFRPSTYWAQGGPIIEQEKIATQPLGGGWFAGVGSGPNRSSWSAYGLTPPIAAMRCYVASKLGDEIDIPKELL